MLALEYVSILTDLEYKAQLIKYLFCIFICLCCVTMLNLHYHVMNLGGRLHNMVSRSTI